MITSRWVMLLTLGAMLPGCAAQLYYLGPGVAINLAAALTGALAAEGLALRARGRSPSALADGSAAITAVIIAASLPAACAWWVPLAAVCFGLLVGKHLFGGLGHNPFNPAMVGYAMAIIAFPDEMTRYGAALSAQVIDGASGATVLDHVRGHRVQGTAAGAADAALLPPAATVIAAAWAVGGLALVVLRVAPWRLPVAFLATLALLGALGHAWDGEHIGSAAYQLTAGGTMLAAAVVITDPVTAPSSRRAQWVFATLVAVLTLAIRTWGAYPDGLAFAVLAMNMAAPALDRLLR